MEFGKFKEVGTDGVEWENSRKLVLKVVEGQIIEVDLSHYLLYYL